MGCFRWPKATLFSSQLVMIYLVTLQYRLEEMHIDELIVLRETDTTAKCGQHNSE